MLNDELEARLRDGLLAPPQDFPARVMARVSARPMPKRGRQVARVRDLVEWLALAGAVLTGTSQLIAFLFGIWTFSNAG